MSPLPDPPEGRTGWPWTAEQRASSIEIAPAADWPRITVVTPSFNQVDYILGAMHIQRTLAVFSFLPEHCFFEVDIGTGVILAAYDYYFLTFASRYFNTHIRPFGNLATAAKNSIDAGKAAATRAASSVALRLFLLTWLLKKA